MDLPPVSGAVAFSWRIVALADLKQLEEGCGRHATQIFPMFLIAVWAGYSLHLVTGCYTLNIESHVELQYAYIILLLGGSSTYSRYEKP